MGEGCGELGTVVAVNLTVGECWGNKLSTVVAIITVGEGDELGTVVAIITVGEGDELGTVEQNRCVECHEPYPRGNGPFSSGGQK